MFSISSGEAWIWTVPGWGPGLGVGEGGMAAKWDVRKARRELLAARGGASLTWGIGTGKQTDELILVLGNELEKLRVGLGEATKDLF